MVIVSSCLHLSMIVDYFDVLWAVCRPDKADAPLPIDADRMLAGAVAMEFFEMVARRETQVFQYLR